MRQGYGGRAFEAEHARVCRSPKTSCPVGQITGIFSSSQQLSPRRETGRGLFKRMIRTEPPKKTICSVGQITSISSSSQEFCSPRRETGRGLFQLGNHESDGSRRRIISSRSASRRASERAAVRAPSQLGAICGKRFGVISTEGRV